MRDGGDPDTCRYLAGLPQVRGGLARWLSTTYDSGSRSAVSLAVLLLGLGSLVLLRGSPGAQTGPLADRGTEGLGRGSTGVGVGALMNRGTEGLARWSTGACAGAAKSVTGAAPAMSKPNIPFLQLS